MHRRQLFTLALACLALIGCGQTGPLYLPDRAGTPVQPEQQPNNPTPESRRDPKRQPATDDASATDTQSPAPLPDPASPTSPPSN